MEATLGSDLRRWRAARGLALTAAARQAGLSRATLNRWENDEVAPTGSALDRLLNVLGVDAREKAEKLATVAPKGSPLLMHGPLGSPVHFGQALRALRSVGLVSQSALAQAVGVSQAAVAKWEAGTTVPGYEALERVLTALRADDDERAWIRVLAVGEPAPIRTPEEGKAWLAANRPAEDIVNTAQLLAFERFVWERAVRDSRWERLLVETMAWRTLAQWYMLDPDVKRTADAAMSLARQTGAWDEGTLALLIRHASLGKRSLTMRAIADREFDAWFARLTDEEARRLVLLEWSTNCRNYDDRRAEAMGNALVEHASKELQRRNEVVSREDGRRVLANVKSRLQGIEAALDYQNDQMVFVRTDEWVPLDHLTTYALEYRLVGQTPPPRVWERLTSRLRSANTPFTRYFRRQFVRDYGLPPGSFEEGSPAGLAAVPPLSAANALARLSVSQFRYGWSGVSTEATPLPH